MSNPEDQDLTAESGGPTDVAPLGRSGPKPEHERTAAEDMNRADWEAIANDPDFVELKRSKRSFLIPWTIFFLVYYMTLPVLVGFCPETMKTPVLGKVNWAYLFALSQFVMTWVLCAIYVRQAKKWDAMNTALLAKFNHY
jgi:uncharacterized membrane protein (DUF485 family)